MHRGTGEGEDACHRSEVAHLPQLLGEEAVIDRLRVPVPPPREVGAADDAEDARELSVQPRGDPPRPVGREGDGESARHRQRFQHHVAEVRAAVQRGVPLGQRVRPLEVLGVRRARVVDRAGERSGGGLRLAAGGQYPQEQRPEPAEEAADPPLPRALREVAAAQVDVRSRIGRREELLDRSRDRLRLRGAHVAAGTVDVEARFVRRLRREVQRGHVGAQRFLEDVPGAAARPQLAPVPDRDQQVALVEDRASHRLVRFLLVLAAPVQLQHSIGALDQPAKLVARGARIEVPLVLVAREGQRAL